MTDPTTCSSMSFIGTDKESSGVQEITLLLGTMKLETFILMSLSIDDFSLSGLCAASKKPDENQLSKIFDIQPEREEVKCESYFEACDA